MTDPNTIIITRTLTADEMFALRRALASLWPDVAWTILHGRMLRSLNDMRAAVGPSEFKEIDPDVTTVTAPPRYEG